MSCCLSQFRYWVFDLDGTLTVAQHNFEEIRQKLGLPPGQPILEFIAAQSLQRQVELNTQLDAIELALAQNAQPQPGAINLIQRLHASGAKLAILTRNNRANAMAVLAAFNLLPYFAEAQVLGREQCAAKPAADGIEQLLCAWNAPRKQTIMVGDYLYDLQAGKAAGVATAHFCLDRNRQWPEFSDYVVDRLEQLLCL